MVGSPPQGSGRNEPPESAGGPPHPPLDLAGDLSGGAGPSTRPALGTPATQAPEAGGPAPLAPGGLHPPRSTLVARADCARVAAAVSCRTDDAHLPRSDLHLSLRSPAGHA